MLIADEGTDMRSWFQYAGLESFPYLLCREGLDVYLFNRRGSVFSRNNDYFDPDSAEYWDFGIEDGAVDLGAAI